jgi:hypothetical protein
VHGSGQPSICAKLYRTNCEDCADYIPGQSLVRRIGQRMSELSDIKTCLAGLVAPNRPRLKLAKTSDRLLIAAIEFVVCRLESPVLDQESEGKDL